MQIYFSSVVPWGRILLYNFSFLNYNMNSRNVITEHYLGYTCLCLFIHVNTCFSRHCFMIIIFHLTSLKMFDIVTWIIDYCLFRYWFQSDASMVVMVNLSKQNTFYFLPNYIFHESRFSKYHQKPEHWSNSGKIRPGKSWGRPQKTSYGCP